VPNFPNIATRYPPALLEERARVAEQGSFRDRVRFDLVDRAYHAFGLLTAADVAKFAEIDEFVAVEFGVAEGAGLRNLADVAAQVTEETGVRVRLVGFDSGGGLPEPLDHRDHPEIWSAGDFAMPDAEAIRAALPRGSELVLGPIASTLPSFLERFDGPPIGFVSFDVDFYSSTVDALALFEVDAQQLLPVVVSYFDDILGGLARIGSLFRNEAAGQLLAIKEFNAQHELKGQRVIDPIRILRYRRPFDREPWIERMYALHVLDHELRQAPRDRSAMSMSEHGKSADFTWPL
jgi:hypothetical protein